MDTPPKPAGLPVDNNRYRHVLPPTVQAKNELAQSGQLPTSCSALTDRSRSVNDHIEDIQVQVGTVTEIEAASDDRQFIATKNELWTKIRSRCRRLTGGGNPDPRERFSSRPSSNRAKSGGVAQMTGFAHETVDRATLFTEDVFLGEQIGAVVADTEGYEVRSRKRKASKTLSITLNSVVEQAKQIPRRLSSLIKPRKDSGYGSFSVAAEGESDQEELCRTASVDDQAGNHYPYLSMRMMNNGSGPTDHDSVASSCSWQGSPCTDVTAWSQLPRSEVDRDTLRNMAELSRCSPRSGSRGRCAASEKVPLASERFRLASERVQMAPGCFVMPAHLAHTPESTRGRTASVMARENIDDMALLSMALSCAVDKARRRGSFHPSVIDERFELLDRNLDPSLQVSAARQHVAELASEQRELNRELSSRAVGCALVVAPSTEEEVYGVDGSSGSETSSWRNSNVSTEIARLTGVLGTFV